MQMIGAVDSPAMPELDGAAEPVWTSGALPFAAAAEVWAAAAGAAGAYFPEEFVRLARVYHLDGWTPGRPMDRLEEQAVPSATILPLLVDEALRRADWRAQFCDALWAGLPFGRPDGSYILPRAPIIGVCGSADSPEPRQLEWHTSVVVILRPTDDDDAWEVLIVGEHPQRRDAAMCALRALREDGSWPDVNCDDQSPARETDALAESGARLRRPSPEGRGDAR